MKKKFQPWKIKDVILHQIKKKGGWVNTHAHIDRAFTLTAKNFPLANAHLHDKWHLVDEIKKRSTVNHIYDRMAYVVERMLQQNVQALGTFIDVDEVVKDKSILAAQKIREKYKKDLKIIFINQALKGVIEKKARYWFDMAVQFVDIIGGLPGKDAGRESEHLDILLGTAKKMEKMVHVHVDQLNTKKETETELLIKKTRQYKLQNRVVAIHGISVAAHKKDYRYRLYRKMADLGIMVISCPSAWLDSRRNEELSPTHNAITPIDEMIPFNITVALGTDNISDIYKPFSDGDMWTELKFLLEACHYYDVGELVKIATVNGQKALGVSFS